MGSSLCRGSRTGALRSGSPTRIAPTDATAQRSPATSPAESARSSDSSGQRRSTANRRDSGSKGEIPPAFFALLELAPKLAEIQPPYGVLRREIECDADIAAASLQIADGIKLVTEDLQLAALHLGYSTMGRIFQALLAWGAAEDARKREREKRRSPKKRKKSKSSAANLSATDESTQRKSSGTMYVGRDDTAARSAVALEKLPGGKKEAAALASRAISLAALLRIKIEDDGDIRTAEVTLDTCQQFFADLEMVSRELGHANPFVTLVQLRGQASNPSGA